MTYQQLHLDLEGSIATLTLTGSDAEHRIDGGLIRELADACEAVNDAEHVRVAVVAGERDTFCGGWAGEPGGSNAFTCLETIRQPVICAINGAAISAGLELALACDVRIAAKDARFGLPETKQGRLPSGGGTQRLARLVGRAEALRMILFGEEIDAEEALRIGLVSKVVQADALQEEAIALANTMASRGPIALRYAKEAVRRGLDLPLDQALRYETDLTVILQSTADRAEGVSAFLEKREPKFEGK